MALIILLLDILEWLTGPLLSLLAKYMLEELARLIQFLRNKPEFIVDLKKFNNTNPVELKPITKDTTVPINVPFELASHKYKLLCSVLSLVLSLSRLPKFNIRNLISKKAPTSFTIISNEEEILSPIKLGNGLKDLYYVTYGVILKHFQDTKISRN
jgi:hypothetical protein